MEKLYKKTGWKNKPNLSTPLGATNLKKIDEALDGLDNRTIELDTQRAKHKLLIDGLYAETDALEKEIKEVRTETNSSIDALKIVPTASGNTVYIDDASNMKLEGIDFFGESKQETTTGTQWLDLQANTSSSASGLSISIEDGYIITVSGKPSETWANLSDYDTKQIPQGKYTFSIDKSPTEIGVGKICIKFRESMSESTIVTHQITGSNKSITFDRLNDYELIQIYADGIDTTKEYNFTIKVMLNAGETALPLEKYTGGKASPSSDYLQPIESTVVNRVDVMRKNICGELIEGKVIDYLSGTAVSNTNYACTDFVRVQKGESYVIHYAFGSAENWFYDISKNTIKPIPATTDGNIKYFTANADGYIRCSLQISNKNLFMIEHGTVATEYEPYQSQTVNLSAPIELNGIGGVRDSSKVKKFGVVVFDGTEKWYKYNEQYPHLFMTNITPYANGINNPVMCTHFPYDEGNLLGGTDGCRFRNDAIATVFYVSSSNHTDVLSFNSWLAQQYANGTPVTLVYKLSEDIETALPQADIDAIKNLHTYKPNTVVMNDADAEMDVHYVADCKLYVDKKFEALASAIVNQ